MGKGITVSLYLVEGDPSGIVCAYLSNWTGHCIKIPRNLLEKAKDRPEVDTMGIYILLGENEENPDEKIVYVGEADNVHRRLVQHIRDDAKSFWNEAIVFSSKDDFLTKGHVKYLEHELIQYAKMNPNFTVHNKNNATKSSLPEMAISDMETFVENVKIILPTLGIGIFREEEASDNKKLYHFEQTGIHAVGHVTSNGFKVLINSEMTIDVKNSLSNGYKNRREMLINKGIVEKTDSKLYLFVSDYEFSSPSAAAAIVIGHPKNGRIAWKDDKGNTLKYNEELNLKNSN